MPSETVARPALFRGDGDATWMRIEHCEECGRDSFPPMGYGCERCGAAPKRLVVLDAPARARLVASTVVSFSPGSDLVVPATVAQLDLDEPFVRFYGVLVGEALPMGTPVEGVVEVREDGTEQLRFREVAA